MNDSVIAQFPILKQSVQGKRLVYLDNAATIQKPQVVIDAISNYYEQYNSNIHRGAHTLAALATDAYEQARTDIANYINADPKTINFVRGTTEGINLVANAWGNKFVQAGDEIIISGLEHHSNIVPWQMLCQRVGASIKVIPVLDNGTLDMEAYGKLLSNKTKLVAVNYVSNALGTINPVKDIIQQAHAIGAKVLIDGAQAMPHMQVDVAALDCDFFCFSGHKVYAPTGIGVLYGKEEILEAMDPYHGGGEMIKTVSYTESTYNDLPYKFEAGTPNICGAIALGTAINWLKEVGVSNIAEHEDKLLKHATESILKIPGVKLFGTAEKKASVLSFEIEGVHSYDLGVLLDKQGIAVRTGHHCCQPLMDSFGIEGTCRASFAVYNTLQDVDDFIAGLNRAIMMLK